MIFLKMQENIITIEHTMQTWKSDPLFLRTDDGRNEPLFNIKGNFFLVNYKTGVNCINKCAPSKNSFLLGLIS